MRAFADAWPDKAIVQQLVGKLPWGHNLELLTKLKNREDREWYTRTDIEQEIEAELSENKEDHIV